MLASNDPALGWADLVAMEPRLDDLAEDIRAIEAGPHFCATAVWYRSFKPRLVRLVGHGRGLPKSEPANADPGHAVSIWELLDTDEIREAKRRQGRTRSRDARKGRSALWSSDAYDIAYDALYALLPECRDCSNCGLDLLLPRGRLHA